MTEISAFFTTDTRRIAVLQKNFDEGRDREKTDPHTRAQLDKEFIRPPPQHIEDLHRHVVDAAIGKKYHVQNYVTFYFQSTPFRRVLRTRFF